MLLLFLRRNINNMDETCQYEIEEGKRTEWGRVWFAGRGA